MNSVHTAIKPNVKHAVKVSLVSRSSTSADVLPTPQQLRQQLPLDNKLGQRVEQHRHAVRAVLRGDDLRLLVVMGPCSIHDPQAALEYAQHLLEFNAQVEDQLLLAMRVYIEKPRTTVGWKGLLYDPHLDGSHDMDTGLRLSRALMLQVAQMGLPIATELLQPLAVQYFSDLISWAAIGARTSESQIHRELVSSLNIPVGFKNSTDGGVQAAIDAMRSAAFEHQYMGVNEQGQMALMRAAGNSDTHLVLRGGQRGANYDAQSLALACQAMEKSGVTPSIMVDCSHANSGKDPLRQPQILQELIAQRQSGNDALRAVMLESHLQDGCQSMGKAMRYGVSITDACLGWDKTQQALLHIAALLRDSR